MKNTKKDRNLIINVGDVEIYKEGKLVYTMDCLEKANIYVDKSNPHKGCLAVRDLQFQIELEKNNKQLYRA